MWFLNPIWKKSTCKFGQKMRCWLIFWKMKVVCIFLTFNHELYHNKIKWNILWIAVHCHFTLIYKIDGYSSSKLVTCCLFLLGWFYNCMFFFLKKKISWPSYNQWNKETNWSMRVVYHKLQTYNLYILYSIAWLRPTYE